VILRVRSASRLFHRRHRGSALRGLVLASLCDEQENAAGSGAKLRSSLQIGRTIMQTTKFVRTSKTFKLAAAALLVALVSGGLYGTGALGHVDARAQTAPLASALEAQEELRLMPTDRIASLRDARDRDAFNYAVSTVEAVANNRSLADEAALLDAADCSIDNLTGVLIPIHGSHACFTAVGTDYKKCQTGCKGTGKKFCGCFAAAVLDTLQCLL
jgi:hypothetical protein